MKVSAAVVLPVIWPVLSFSTVDAFIPAQTNCRTPGTQLWEAERGPSDDVKKSEEILREKIADRNSLLENEAQYAVADGDKLAFVDAGNNDQPIEVSESTTKELRELQKKLDRLRKTRPYPIFLAEKAAEITEGNFGSLVKKIGAGEKRYPKSGRKEKIVVLGTGWGAASFVKDVDTDLYDVIVISPRNYFLFTPMLAGASVGTVEYRSITEPVRELNRKVDFIEGTATEVDPVGKSVTCESVVCDGNSCDIEDFTVEYDKLVVTIGAQTNTFGIPGVREYCNFLKQVDDAQKIRTAIVNCFERANIPSLSEGDRISTLTFAVIGAGPTGIEFAAELRDFIEQDGPKYYPKLLQYVRIKIIEASSTVLAPFTKELQEEAIVQMKRQVQIKDDEVRRLLPERFELVELLLDSSVKEVTEKTIFLNNGREISYGLSVWAAGNGPLPLTLDIIGKLGDEQAKCQDVARGRIATDPWMRAEGSGGSIISFGDCSCIIDGPSGPLPATAQVAAQQGEYLAYLMNKEYDLSPTLSLEGMQLPPTRNPQVGKALSESIAALVTRSDEYAKPFQFLNLGILAYTGGNSALAQISPAPNAPPIKGSGKVGNALWRSVYLSKQVSVRNRVLVLNDWIKRQVFGRDITRL